jgi:vitamin B12 transporter
MWMMRIISKSLLVMSWGFFITLLIAIPTRCPAQARAEAAEDNSTEAVDIGEVRVQGMSEYESLEDAAAFTTVIRPSDFDKRSKSAPELLSRTVGIDVMNRGGEGEFSTVSIRGSSSEEVAVFLDGVRLNTTVGGTVDFSTIPIDSIDRIEVIRGNASARFGTGAMGGVINIITKKAGAKRAIDLKLTGASFETLRTSESWREPGDGWDLVLAHNHRSTAGNFTFMSLPVTLSGQPIGNSQEFTRINNRSVSEDVLAKVSVDITDTLHFTIQNDFYWIDRQVPGMEDETTLLAPANPPEAKEEIFRNTAGIKLNLDKFFIDDLTWQTGVTYFMNRDHFTDPSPAIGDPINVTTLSQTPEFHMQWMHMFMSEDVNLASTFRYQFRYDRSSDSSPLVGRPLMGTHERNSNSLFIEESLGLLDDRIIIIPQGRFETVSDRKSRASWKVGLIGKPIEWLTLKSNVGSAFRYPSFNELYYPDQGYLRGNPNLDDESSLGWDIGFIIKPKYASLEASYFRNSVDNMILWVPISATTIQPVNTFAVDIQGIELQGSLDPIKYLHIDANYTWLDAHYSGTNRRLPGRPKHKINARIEGRIKPVTVFSEIQYIGSYPINTANTVTLSGQTVVDAGTTLTFGKYFFATVEVKNVANVQIHDAVGFPLPRRSYWVAVGANYDKKS